MNADTIRLEFSKQKLAFVGMAAAFAVSIPMAWIGGTLARIETGEAMKALMLFWTALGLPGMAVLMGASSGAGLRAEPSAGAEAPLPLSPRVRAAAAFSAAALQLAGMSILILVVGAALGFARDPLSRLFAWNAPGNARLALTVAAAGMLHLSLTSFACGYALRHGLAGGLLGAVFGGTTALFLGLRLFLAAAAPAHDPTLAARQALVLLLVASAGAAWVALMLAERLERGRRIGWWRTGLAVLALAAGTFLSFGAARNSAERLLRRPLLMNVRRNVWGMHSFLLPGVRQADSRGALAAALEGTLYWLAPDGTQVSLLSNEPLKLKDIVAKPYWWSDFSYVWDEDGSLWVLYRCFRGDQDRKPSHELYHGRPDARLVLHSVLPENPRPLSVVRMGRELGIVSLRDEEYWFAPLPGKGRRPVWGRLGPDRIEAFQQGLVRQGLAVYRGHEGSLRKTLGPKEDLPIVDATMVAGRKLFLIPSRSKEGSVLKVYEGNTLKQRVWPSPENRHYGLQPLPDGSWWGWRDFSHLHLLTKDGKFLEPLSVEKALQRLRFDPEKDGIPEVLRLEEGRLWLLLPDRRMMVTVDTATGELLKRWSLPGRRKDEYWTRHVTNDGIFVDAQRDMFFIRWDGTRTRIAWRNHAP